MSDAADAWAAVSKPMEGLGRSTERGSQSRGDYASSRHSRATTWYQQHVATESRQ